MNIFFTERGIKNSIKITVSTTNNCHLIIFYRIENIEIHVACVVGLFCQFKQEFQAATRSVFGGYRSFMKGDGVFYNRQTQTRTA